VRGAITSSWRGSEVKDGGSARVSPTARLILLIGAACAALAAAPATAGAAAMAPAIEGQSSGVTTMQTAISLMRATDAHVPTWAVDDGCNAGIGVSTALVRQWLTFAQSDCGAGGDHKARGDCRSGAHRYCLVMQYLDTDWSFAQGLVPLAALSGVSKSTWFLHEPAPNAGSPIYSRFSGGGYLVNQADPDVQAFFRSYVRQYFDRDDGLMMDEQSAGLAQELYYSTCGCSKTDEIESNRALQNAHRALSAALMHRNGSPFLQVDNSLPPNPFLPQGFDLIDRRHGVDGLITEGEPMQYGAFDPYYSTLLDQIAYVESRTRGFVVPLSHGTAGAPHLARSRLVQEGTVLLGYRPGRLVDWADLEQGSPDLSVWPEEGIYPTGPVETMRAPRGRGCLAGRGDVCTAGGHLSIEVAPGIYRREFRSCYYRGVLFGACAAIVNSTTKRVVAARRWLRLAYSHEIGLVGADVQSGGTVAVHGTPFAPGRSVVPPQDAILLSR
jgi:hypothetical protein